MDDRIHAHIWNKLNLINRRKMDALTARDYKRAAKWHEKGNAVYDVYTDLLAVLSSPAPTKKEPTEHVRH